MEASCETRTVYCEEHLSTLYNMLRYTPISKQVLITCM